MAAVSSRGRGVQANISVANPGLTADGKASAVIDYGKTENILFRAIREEVRRVSTSLSPLAMPIWHNSATKISISSSIWITCTCGDPSTWPPPSLPGSLE